MSAVDPTTLPLQPQEFYIFSQMTEVMTFADLKTRCVGVGDFDAGVARLIELGAITGPEDAPAADAPGGEPAEGGVETEQRSADEQEADEDAPDRAPERKAEGGRTLAPRLRSDSSARVSDALPDPSGLPDVELVPENDARLEPDIALGIEFQRCVLAALDAGRKLNAFRVLGIGPTEDERRIKRAFHALSRKLHPDAYFGQNLGRYSPRLERLFTLAKLSFTTLKDRAKRDAVMSEWFEEESQQSEERTVSHRHNPEFELARQKAAELRRSKRNRDRSRDRARRRASTNVDDRDQQVEALRAQALKELDAGRAGEALSVLHRAKGMLRPGSALREQIEAEQEKVAKVRGKEAYSRAVRARKEKRSKEAAALFDEAASIAPSLEYLVEAAISMAAQDPKRGREHAMGALSELARRQAEGRASAAVAGRTHYAAAVAFHAAGLMTSARSEARQAEEFLGDTPDLRALLKRLAVQ